MRLLVALAFFVASAGACSEAYVSTRVNCTNDLDCNLQGRCNVTSGACVCSTGYITYGGGSPCGYRQKKQLVAFLLACFIPFGGADQFYLGHDDFGIGKIFYFIGSLFMFCIAACVLRTTAVRLGVLYAAMILWFLGVIIWWLYDVGTIGTCQQNDVNQAPLEGW